MSSTPIASHDSRRRAARQPIPLPVRTRLERHLSGLVAHLEAIGLRAEANACRTELDMLREARG